MILIHSRDFKFSFLLKSFLGSGCPRSQKDGDTGHSQLGFLSEARLSLRREKGGLSPVPEEETKEAVPALGQGRGEGVAAGVSALVYCQEAGRSTSHSPPDRQEQEAPDRAAPEATARGEARGAGESLGERGGDEGRWEVGLKMLLREQFCRRGGSSLLNS